MSDLRLVPRRVSLTTGTGWLMILFWAIICLACLTHCHAADTGLNRPLQTKEAEEQGKKIGPWHEVTDWTHSWDTLDVTTYEDDGVAWGLPAATRIASVKDRGHGKDNRPLNRDQGRWAFHQGLLRPMPGPQLIRCAAQFNGRSAWITDFLGRGGFCGEVFATLSPVEDPRDNRTWFNAPNGYPAPYWGAVLCRPANVKHNFNAWDGFNGQIGTIVTLGKGFYNNVWGATTSIGLGDPWPQTNVVGSDQQTVMLIAQVDGANSFMEFHQRDANGKLTTQRATFTLKSYPVREMFFGHVHSSYVSVVGLKLGLPTEAELKKVRAWAEPWLPPKAALPLPVDHNPFGVK